MQIKAYFITYKNNKELSDTITSFVYNGGKVCDITIVNNSPSVPISIPYIPINYKVIDNNTRPDFSTGHLARNWNECLVDGFKDVNNPDCDIVILSQNDVRYSKGFIDKLYY
jgi:GT2 family glycosyltransferase